MLRHATAPGNRAIAVAAQASAAEERVLGEQLRLALPDSAQEAFARATDSSASRRDTLRQAVVDPAAVTLSRLLPGVRDESGRVRDLSSDLVTSLADTVSARTNDARSDALRDTALVIAALLTALAAALVVARSLLSPVRTLRQAALAAAREQLPRTVERVRAGEQVDWTRVQSVPVRTTEEIGQLARAFDDMHEQAVRLAGEHPGRRRARPADRGAARRHSVG